MKKTDFKFNIGDLIIKENMNITITDRKIMKDNQDQNRKYYKYTCNLCGFDSGKHYRNCEHKKEYWIMEFDLLKAKQCTCCHGRIVVEGINDIPTTAPWLIPYFQGGYDEAKKYNHGSENKICAICPDCGHIKNEYKIKYMYLNNGIGCNCSDGNSYVSKYMFNLLLQLNDEKQICYFDVEKTYKWLKFYNPFKKKYNKKSRYDFVIETNKLIIETDGEFHRKDNTRSGQSKEESKFLDDEKDRLAKENGYKVIRISDKGDIKQNILDSDLNGLFDLSKIDWIKCHEFALSNLVKVVCDYWKIHNNINNENLTTKDLGLIFKKSSVSISSYLKQGHNLKWCKYDAKKESIRICSNNGKSLGKQVEIFQNKISLGIFPSISELERKSEEIFGVKLLITGISNVCNGKKQQYKGYTFSYTSEDLKEVANF